MKDSLSLALCLFVFLVAGIMFSTTPKTRGVSSTTFTPVVQGDDTFAGSPPPSLVKLSPALGSNYDPWNMPEPSTSTLWIREGILFLAGGILILVLARYIRWQLTGRI